MRQRMWLLAALALGLMLVQLGAPKAQEKAKYLNPYAGNPEAIKEGRTIWLKYGCQGCHGVGGGGGMGPAVLDDVWKFGSDDETLFKLIRGEIPQQTMPAVLGQAMTEEEIWKTIAYIRSLYKGDPSKIDWAPLAKGPEAAPPAQEVAAPAVVEKGDPLARGKAAYTTICLSCHGPEGKGDGPVAAALNPKPRDFTDKGYMAQLDDKYLFEVISKGGAAVGKSPLMPPAALGEQEIRNVIEYIRGLAGGGSQLTGR